MNTNQLVGLLVTVLNPRLPALRDERSLPVSRDERGLSQSTENAVLLAGAVTVAMIVIAAVKGYVTKNMPK